MRPTRLFTHGWRRPKGAANPRIQPPTLAIKDGSPVEKTNDKSKEAATKPRNSDENFHLRESKDETKDPQNPDENFDLRESKDETKDPQNLHENFDLRESKEETKQPQTSHENFDLQETKDVTAEDIQNTSKRSRSPSPFNSSSSESSSSSEDSSSMAPCVDCRPWDSDWHDTWQSAVSLRVSSVGCKRKARIANTLLKRILAAKREWDQAA